MAGTEREMEKGISLYELQQRVKEAVDGAMKELLWVSGEISEFKQNSNGHCYMELVDYNSDQGVVAARARAVVWSRNAAMLLPYFKTLTGSELAAGMKILVKVQVQYTPLYGLSLNILDIEPTFTVGEAEVRPECLASLGGLAKEDSGNLFRDCRRIQGFCQTPFEQ